MPFIGEVNGEYVTPVSVGDNAVVTCPECGGEMGVRESHWNGSNFISRHFHHKRGGGGCGGESDIHKRMKTIAYEKLDSLFDEGEVELEKHIGKRFGDVAITFPEGKHPYGRGVIVEVQHKHKAKNIGQVSREYFERGYSVFWAYQSDFDGHDMRFNTDDDRFWTLWPEGIPREKQWSGVEKYTAEVAATCPEEIHLEVLFPLEYFWEAVEAEQKEQEREQIREDQSGVTYGKVWLHGKGSNLSWFTVHETTSGEMQLRLWEKSKGMGSPDVFTVLIDETAVDAVKSFVEEAQMKLNESEAYKSRSDWYSIATAWLTGHDSDTTVWLSFAKPPNDRIQVVLGRKTDAGGSEKVVIPRRRGDEHRLEELVDVLERAFE